MLPLRWNSAAPFEAATHAMRRPGSLTARLALTGRVSLDVLASGRQPARPDEARQLGLHRPGRRIYAREVRIHRDGQVAILARSVTTLEGIAGPWKGLRRLGRSPLATLLWTNPRIRRGPFEFVRLPADDPLVRASGARRALPARRSTFWLEGQPLIVMEAFVGLPWPRTAWQARRRRWAATR